jgi:hypothetical protein
MSVGALRLSDLRVVPRPVPFGLTDAAGENRQMLFDLKRDAEDFDLQCRAGVAAEAKVDQGERSAKFSQYAERWQLSRKIGQALDYQRHIDSRLRHHLDPHFGDRQSGRSR